MPMPGHPLHSLPAISAIDPEQPYLFTGTAEMSTEEASSSWVRHGGGRDDNGHQEPEGIDQHVTFTAFHVFAFVVAALSSQLCSLDALAVEAASSGMFVSAFVLADLGTHGIVEALPVAAVAPLRKVPIEAIVVGIRMSEHAPLDPPVNDIKDGIDDGSHIEDTTTTTRFGWRNQIFDTIPFGIREVCGVWFRSHPYSLLS